MSLRSGKKNVRFFDGASQTLIAATVVPKNRKPKFELVLKILDLNNVPLVTGSCYVSWHLSGSIAAEHRGKTPRAAIKDHKVVWDYSKTIQLRVTADRQGVLQTTDMNFEVQQEYHSRAGKAERITLGVVKLNLAEYVDASLALDEADADWDGTSAGVVRRYLMQESRINSTIKISILMKQIEGERNFTAPTLKTAPIFGGIAGIMNQEQAETDDLGNLPTRKLSRDRGREQDVYRRTLAASWASDKLDLPADECIEDIFAGGDGWGKHANGGPDPDTSDTEHLQVPSLSSHRRSSYNNRQKHGRQHSYGSRRGNDEPGHTHESPSGRTTPENQAHSSSSDDHIKGPRRRQNEISEFELREDLRSWEIPAPTD